MLRQAWEAAPNAEGTLLNQLIAFEAQANALVNSATITGSSNSGRQTSLAPARQGEKTLLETADAWTQLIDLFNSVTGAQQSLSPPGKTDDATIYALMQTSPDLQGVKGYTTNFMYLTK